MSEAIRNLALLVWAVCAINNNNTAHANMVVIGEEAPADGEVMVYGAAKNASGKTDEVLVEQPSANENPLGNPIVAPDDVATPVSAESVSPVAPVAEPAPDTSPRIEETLPQNPAVSSETPQEVNGQIQDTLYESGGRIYDVQSYPASDIKKIEEPNINPTINTYPSY